MKTLSIRQPWAQLIIHHGKDIENRTWRTNYRGPLLIHASSTKSWDDYGIACEMAGDILGHCPIGPFHHIDFGCIIGIVDLVDCVSESDSPWFCGPYGLLLWNPRPINPIPVKGRLGLWNFNLSPSLPTV